MPQQNDTPKLIPTRKQSLSQAVSDVFTQMLQPEKTGLDPQEIGRGYTQQQPEPYEAMPSTPKGFKTVKSLDDFLRTGKEGDLLSDVWYKAVDKVRKNILWLRKKGEIADEGKSITEDTAKYLEKKYGIKGDIELVDNLPTVIQKTMEYNPGVAQRQKQTISKYSQQLEEIKDKPVLIKPTPKEELDVPELLRGRSELKSIKMLKDATQSRLDITNEGIKKGYKFILENKDNLIKGFNNFVRQTDDEIEADVKRIFNVKKDVSLTKKERKLEKIRSSLENANADIEDARARGETGVPSKWIKEQNIGDYLRKEYGLGGKYSAFKGLNPGDYNSTKDYIRGMEEFVQKYKWAMDDDLIPETDLSGIIKNVESLIDMLKKENPKPNLSVIKNKKDD